MKTIAIPTLGWTEWECDAFEQYVEDAAADFYANVSITYTTDHHFEIDIPEEDAVIEWLIVRASDMDTYAE